MKQQRTSTGLEPTLAHAFARTEYRIRHDSGPAVVRIGERLPAGLQRACRGRAWAILTAFNPGAQLAEPQTNARSDRALVRRLRALRPAMLLRSVHRDPQRRWPDESGWWLCPIALEQACRIGREYGQLAVVAGGPGGRAEIFECRADERHNANANDSTLDPGATS